MDNTTTLTEFATEVNTGLTAEPKYLHSKYFYDDRGSEIFEQIMRMPEYYLTDCELEIFEKQKTSLCDDFIPENGAFELVELGAGDGLKTKQLLKELLDREIDFTYSPIDISQQAVQQLQNKLWQELPGVKIHGLIGDYFHLIEGLNGSKPKVILFLGSNIGNFSHEKSLSFLKQLHKVLNSGDKLLIGFDLKKDPEIILKAYNDPHGLTASFNLNLLQRMNKELGADFILENFRHIETYHPKTGTAKSFLISQCKQQVHFAELDKTFSFENDERIFMEMSQKYDSEMIHSLAENTGFEVVSNFTDSRQFFINSIWEKIEK